MALSWYYADQQRQQQGPVSDSWLLNAYQRGEVGLSTLVWHEGMAQWQPLSQVARELGIDTRGAPPSMPPPVRAPVVAPSKSSSGCAVAAIVIVVGLFVIGGILAAIAIPAYNDYLGRAKASMALMEGSRLRSDVVEFYSREERCPINGDEGFGNPESYATAEVRRIEFGSLSDGRCAIQVIVNQLGSSRETDGGEFLFALDADMNWTQSSTLPQRFLPASMRNNP